MNTPTESNHTRERKPQPLSFSTAVLYWLKLGFISFGGPAGQISIMYQELVERRRWISEHRFLHALNFTMILPGPEAQQLATYIGWLMHGIKGGIVAGILFVLPSLFILIGLTWIYLLYGDVAIVTGILYGIKPAVTAIVVFAAYRIGARILKNGILWSITLLSFLAIFVLQIPFPYIVLTAGLTGYLGGQFIPEKFTISNGQVTATDISSLTHPALINDSSPIPAHARFKLSRVYACIGIGIAIWASAIAVLIAIYGMEGTLTHMGLFFTKAALVTFGGAYAVLSYIYQGGVDHYHWLTGTQMIDGLALGETTPGPLIIIVSFVGFIGGWTKEIFGADSLALAGIAGASVATFFTFLPSFLFIFLFGPAVEASRNEVKFTGPLMAITAAVVGVIINLALFFAWHVLWPEASFDALFAGTFQWFAAVITIAALIALWRFKLGVILLIIICATAGLGYNTFLA